MERRIAVLADIHSNHIALEACLEEALKRRAEAFLFLGDYLGDLAYPEKTLDLLDRFTKRYPCTLIRGNKEDYWINHRKGIGNWQAGSSGTGMLAYVYDRLTPEQIDAFARLPIARTMEYPGFPPFVICHGSPWKVNESLREDYDYIDERTKLLETELTVCAHFHIQCAYTRHGKRVVNPGSVGVSLRSGGQAQFMLLHGTAGRWKPEFITLPYDRERAIREMDEERLFAQAPGWYRATKEILRGGAVTHLTLLAKVHDLYALDTGVDAWSGIPERYWEQALRELGIPE